MLKLKDVNFLKIYKNLLENYDGFLNFVKKFTADNKQKVEIFKYDIKQKIVSNIVTFVRNEIKKEL